MHLSLDILGFGCYVFGMIAVALVHSSDKNYVDCCKHVCLLDDTVVFVDVTGTCTMKGRSIV